MWLPHPCGITITSLFSARYLPQNAKICAQRRPTVGSRAIHKAVPRIAIVPLSMMRRGPSRKRTKARCDEISPPRQPRCRIVSSAGGRGFCCAGLKIEEYTGGASPSVIRGFLMMLNVQVHAPVWTDPLTPAAADLAHWKVEAHIECWCR